MASSSVSYVALASQQDFVITFGFLNDGHLTLTIDGSPVTAYTLPDTVTLRLDTPASSGEVVKIARNTPDTLAGQLVDFSKGSPVTEVNMDTFYRQLLYVIQEQSDSLDDVVVSAGNLPVVTGSDDDSSLAVVGGEWATRTNSEMRAHLGLGTAATLDHGVAVGNAPRIESVSGTPGFAVLDGSQLINLPVVAPAGVVRYIFDPAWAIPIDGTGTWHTDTANDVDINGVLQNFGNAEANIALSTSTDTLTLKPGLYQITVEGIVRNTDTTLEGFIEYDWVNHTTDARVNVTAEVLRAPKAPTTEDQASLRVAHTFFLNVLVTTFYVLRMKTAASTSTNCLFENGHCSVVRLSDDV